MPKPSLMHLSQSGDEESCEILQLAGKSEETNPKVLQTCIFDRRKSLHPDNTQLSYTESDPQFCALRQLYMPLVDALDLLGF